MKIKKEQFKRIIKECILELVKDGSLNDIISESNFNGKKLANNNIITEENNPYQFNDNVGNLSPNERLKSVVKTAASQFSMGDPKQAKLMAAIFEDTAKTTLQHSLQNESKRDATGMYIGEEVNPYQIKKEQQDLEALSGGFGVKRWAAVAFAKK